MARLVRSTTRDLGLTSIGGGPVRRMGSYSLLKEKAYVNGSWVGAESGKTFEVFNPMSGKVLCSVPDMASRDTEAAVEAASEAFQTWQYTTVKERSNLLRAWYNLCVENGEDLAKLLTAEQGKPLPEARGEIGYGNSFLEWFSEEARRINGEIAGSPTNTKEMLFIRQPIGVAAMITPWNFPNAMITRKAGAALAAGCTCVIKPAEDTPLSALALGELAEQAGIPRGVINIVTASRENTAEVGRVLSESPLVAGLSFTGSTQVGKILYRQSASTVKRLGLELGGNAAFIVFESADLDLAVAGCMASKFRNAGQTCVSTNRVLVQDKVHHLFVEKLKAAMESQLVLGDGFADGVTQGPLINKSQHSKVCSMVESAVSSGAKVVMGGGPSPVSSLHYQPTILTEVTDNMTLFQEEIFGPVISVAKFSTEQEALDIANDCRTGLASYFYSNDVKQCWRVGKRLQTGMVGINEGMISAAEAAFGGVKESGFGREGSSHGIDDYTNIKYLCFGNL
eukprot:GFUD01015283.1.p1 GENE.GFUD01015283.1~~GFUD01015283.1.p1  ORF type:complete len:536 (-),score=199.14 GFUD01015283.1:218-1747(-)